MWMKVQLITVILFNLFICLICLLLIFLILFVPANYVNKSATYNYIVSSYSVWPNSSNMILNFIVYYIIKIVLFFYLWHRRINNLLWLECIIKFLYFVLRVLSISTFKIASWWLCYLRLTGIIHSLKHCFISCYCFILVCISRFISGCTISFPVIVL